MKPAGNVRESMSTQKIGNIMKYLDEVESQTDADIGSTTTVGNAADAVDVPSPVSESARSVQSHRSGNYSDIKSKLVAITVELNVRKRKFIR